MRTLIEVTEEYQPGIARGLFRARWRDADGAIVESEHPFPDIIWRNVVWEELANYMGDDIPPPPREIHLITSVAGWLPWAVWAIAGPFYLFRWQRPGDAIFRWLVGKACNVGVCR